MSESQSPIIRTKEEQRDFYNWLEYHNKVHRESQLSEDLAWEIYQSYYPCDCETCHQRKRLGYAPYKIAGERPNCQAPFQNIDVSYVRSYLGMAPPPPPEGKQGKVYRGR